MLLAWLLATSSVATAQEACAYVRFPDVVAVPSPSVVVLGERHGFKSDLGRALKVARRFATEGPVTIALEAVHRKHQPVLDAFAAKKVPPDELADQLDWEHEWGFAYRAYEPLVTAAEEGMRVVAVGVDLGPKPEGVEVPIPPRYLDLLRPAMGGHDVPKAKEADFVAAMAWRDRALAEAAVKAWDGKGRLVLVVGRGHVEGGKGVAWQADLLTDAPIASFVLAPGPNPPCHEGDRLWK